MIQKCNLEAGSIEQQRRKGIGFATGGTKEDPVPSEVGNGETGAPLGEARDELQSHARVGVMKRNRRTTGASVPAPLPFLKSFPAFLRCVAKASHGKPRVRPREPAESGGVAAWPARTERGSAWPEPRARPPELEKAATGRGVLACTILIASACMAIFLNLLLRSRRVDPR